MNLKSAFTRKFGPLPAWAWMGLFAVGVYAYRKVRGGGSGSSSSSASTTPAAAIDPGVGAGAADLTGSQDMQPTQDPLDPSQAPSAGNLTLNIDPGSNGNNSDAGDGTSGDNVDTHDPATGVSTPAKTPAHKPKKTTGRKKPRKAPELISEHGKGQNHLPHPKGHHAQPATRPGKTKKANKITRSRTPSAGGGGTTTHTAAHPAAKSKPRAKVTGGGTTAHKPTPKTRNPDLGAQKAPGPPPKSKPKRPRYTL